MSDDPAATDPDTDQCDHLEAMLTQQYIDRLEALDAETERLLESITDSDAEPFDKQTRAQARRHLREIRAQIHPLVLALRYRRHTDEEPREST